MAENTRARRHLLTGLVCGLLAGMLAPAGAAAATPGVITGDPLQLYMDGVGHLQVQVSGFPTPELAPANLNLADPSRTAGLLFRIMSGGVWGGCQGSPPAFVPGPAAVSGPTVASGTGTVADPFTMSAVYDCSQGPPGSGLEITQTFTYVNGDDHFRASYAIKALTFIPSPVQFRATAFGAFDEAGSQLGAGFHDAATAGSPQDVGALNDNQGVEGWLSEVPGSPWSAFMEGQVGSVYLTALGPAQGDQIGPGLDDSVDPTLQRPAAAAQFDRYAAVGLAAGASDVFAVDWFFLDYPGLTLDAASGTNTVGQTQTVTATSLDHGQPVPGETIRYAITGANPSSGVLTTGPTGAAAISWKGTQAGQDTLSAYTDANNDGVFDPGIDTAQTVGVNWSAPPPPAATPPVSTGPPAAAGTAQVGALLTCSPGTWSGSTPQSYAYQWLRDGTPVSPSSAAGSAYKVGAGDAGHGLSCAVTATNAAGSATARSATLAVPAPLSAKFAVVAVRLTAFLARGLTTSESCSAACSVTVVAALDPAQARRAGFGHVRQVLGRATGHLTAPGQLNLPIKPSAKIRSRLRRAKLNRLTITLRATTVDGQGQAGPAGVARLVVKR